MSAVEPVVSFIVPTRNSARTIGRCLESIRNQRDAAVELIVVDNCSSDGTREIAEAQADVFSEGGPERSAQRNLGAKLSRGDWLVFIDSDMVLEDDVAKDVQQTFVADPSIGGLVLPEHAFGEGYFARCRKLEKQLYLGDANVEAARAFPAGLFEQLGGYDEHLTGPEDWDLPDRVRRSGRRISRTTAAVWHDEGTVELATVFRKKVYYGRSIPSYIHKGGGTARRKLLRTGPLAKPALLLRKPNLAAGLLLLKAVEGAGLLVGMWSGRRRSNRNQPAS